VDSNQLEERKMGWRADTMAHFLTSYVGGIMPFFVWLLLPERAERENKPLLGNCSLAVMERAHSSLVLQAAPHSSPHVTPIV